MLVGVISDTHGWLRPEALQALRGCQTILHAGDVGDPEVLTELRALAPVTAVRGNVDSGALGALPQSVAVELEGVNIYMLHIREELDLDPVVAGFRVVICGHTHQPRIEERHGVLWLNPGSAGPPRFKLPVTLARLTLEQGKVDVELVDLCRTGLI